ncbi:MAG: FIST C-terminal domain-containing protein [Candidatus Omnitrophica bacterium]|nr:FIST C-terminal domain-containing protein [Candidatus Omnitrophota bacterium]
MPGNVAIGWSNHSSAFTAGQTAAKTAAKRLGARAVSLVLVFGSSWYDQAQLLEGVRAILGQVPLSGGSTAGELTPDGPQSRSCVVLAVAADAGLRIGVGCAGGLQGDPRLAGHDVAQQAVRQLASAPRHGFLFFGDGLYPRYTKVLQGIQEVLGTHFLVAGGLTGDDLRLTATFQYGETVKRDAITGLLFGEGCRVGVGLEHGFQPISKPRKITRAQDNVVYELDGKPASSVYEEYLGATGMAAIQQTKLSRVAVAYPLGIRIDQPGRFLLRHVLSFGERGSLVCTGEMVEGVWVHLMLGSKGLALEAASAAAGAAMRQMGTVEFVLVFSSAVRRRLLGRDAQLELARIRQVIGPAVPVAGFYTYGEQAPFHTSLPYGFPAVQTGACLVVAVGTS